MLYTDQPLDLFPKTTDNFANGDFSHLLNLDWKFPDRCGLEPIRELKISELAPVHSFVHVFL